MDALEELQEQRQPSPFGGVQQQFGGAMLWQFVAASYHVAHHPPPGQQANALNGQQYQTDLRLFLRTLGMITPSLLEKY